MFFFLFDTSESELSELKKNLPHVSFSGFMSLSSGIAKVSNEENYETLSYILKELDIPSCIIYFSDKDRMSIHIISELGDGIRLGNLIIDTELKSWLVSKNIKEKNLLLLEQKLLSFKKNCLKRNVFFSYDANIKKLVTP